MRDILDAVADFINQVGFPIAAFVAMYYMCFHILGDIKNTLVELRVALNELSTMIEKCHGKDEK